MTICSYRKIPKLSPGAYIFQRPFLRGLYSEGLIYGGKFAFPNRLEVNLPFLLCFTLYLRAIFQVQAPPGGGGGLYLEGLIFVILRYLREDARSSSDKKGAELLFGSPARL